MKNRDNPRVKLGLLSQIISLSDKNICRRSKKVITDAYINWNFEFENWNSKEVDIVSYIYIYKIDVRGQRVGGNKKGQIKDCNHLRREDDR